MIYLYIKLYNNYILTTNCIKIYHYEKRLKLNIVNIEVIILITRHLGTIEVFIKYVLSKSYQNVSVKLVENGTDLQAQRQHSD